MSKDNCEKCEGTGEDGFQIDGCEPEIWECDRCKGSGREPYDNPAGEGAQ